MSTKPGDLGRWATAVGANVVVPPSGKQDAGHQFAELPEDGFENWLKKTAYLWHQYVSDGLLSGAFGLTSQFAQAVASGAVVTFDNLAIGDVTALKYTYLGTNGSQISGIAGGIDGRLLFVFNEGAALGNTLALLGENAGSIAANRIVDGATLTNHGSCILRYEGGSVNRWRIAASHKLQ